MRFTKSLALLASIAFADAQFTKPLAGDYFNIGEKFAIEWETTGLQGPINIDLVPSGVTDGSVVAERIGEQIQNVGRLYWAPDASIAAFDSFMMVITDSAKATVMSQSFKIKQLTDQPIVQTYVGAEVQVLTKPPNAPKTIYSGDLPPEATPAGLVVEAAPAKAAPANGTIPAAPAKSNAAGDATAPAETAPATTTPATGGRRKGKGKGRGGNRNSDGAEATAAPTTSAPAGQPAAGGNGTDAAPSPIFSTIDPAGGGVAAPSPAPIKNNQTAPATTPAATEQSRVSIKPSATPTASLPQVLIPPKNSSTPAEASATQPAVLVPGNTTVPAVSTPAESKVAVPANTTVPAATLPA
ncbi:unnamed protein product, partial [Colletotrichum noveboracense]